jgi:hypothetical protein
MIIHDHDFHFASAGARSVEELADQGPGFFPETVIHNDH